jgi:lipopolysaccharide assembly protein B
MPTEAAFFFAGLLFVAAALGYVFARLGQLDDEQGKSGLDYVRGLKFILKEQPDRAIEALTGSGVLDEDTIETHFALGQLFRRRGEVERAIRVHRDLLDRPQLPREQREQAQFELAEDYLGAGLFDRAESLLGELRNSQRFGVEALRKLVRLAELTREWERAVELRRALERETGGASAHGETSHYFCELAEQARAARDPGQAAAWLDRADAGRQDSARVLFVRSAVASDQGDHDSAIRCLQRLGEREPSLLVEVLPRLNAACTAAGQPEVLSRYLASCIEKDPATARAIAFATMLDARIADPRALQSLWDFMAADQTLQLLVDQEKLQHATAVERAQALERVRGALRAMASAGRSYRCMECGYSSITLQWQCPGCAAWDTVRPRIRLAFASSDR